MREVRIVALAAAAALVGAAPLWVGAQANKEGSAQKKAAVASPGSAECIPQAIRASVDECPAGAPRLDKSTSLLGKSQAPKSNLAAAERKKDKPKDRPMGPSVEIDAATHTGVDDVRQVIVEPLALAPMRDRFKIFIIDEVHRLSKQAFDALLKSIEEPPSYVKFMMATTDPQHVPETIKSRSQVFELKALPFASIREQLRRVMGEEGTDVDDAALALVSRHAEGSMRDALSALDQVLAFEGAVWDKAQDMDEAERKLRALRGRTHDLVGGVALADGQRILLGLLGRMCQGEVQLSDACLNGCVIELRMRADEGRNQRRQYGQVDTAQYAHCAIWAVR